jgi:quercetin dioxygenase-like cupin family protein
VRVERQSGWQVFVAPRFDGVVHGQSLHASTDDGQPNVGLVNFDAGGHTAWHVHSGRQLIYVLGGELFVETQEGERETLSAGDLVECRAGQPHRHGAEPGSEARSLVLTWGVTDWTPQRVRSTGHRASVDPNQTTAGTTAVRPDPRVSLR